MALLYEMYPDVGAGLSDPSAASRLQTCRKLPTDTLRWLEIEREREREREFIRRMIGNGITD